MSDKPILNLRPAAETRWDCAALGEVMLRLDPGDGRVRNARQFQVWEGGGEYNFARGMSKCWGKRATVATALPDSDLGWLVQDLIGQGGVDMSHVVWRQFDGLGRNTRVGLNFTERGFGVRPALGVSDRANSAASQLRPGEIDWERLFGEEGVRWFHTGGVFTALASNTAEVVLEALEVAKKHGVIVSFDQNYRASLWKDRGGLDAAQALNRKIAAMTDVMIGNDHDFVVCLGMEIDGLAKGLEPTDPANFKTLAPQAVKAFPNLKVLATTLRAVRSASVNDFGAILWADGAFYEAPMRDGLAIYDRIGGGDGFASGLAYALMENLGPQAAVDYGAAHAALAMTTPGDTSMVRLKEVEALVKGAGARVIR
ncbi:sugar kinase [Caulobacter zeae]|uniref:Sugar kinase n=1 Tax=Caulobacter zeae TaxID=2055137 RepID=A0A2N5DGY0_9CAUL|nr:sugar kinase [Caulobacter zeae]PLR25246.1 sugar kinase [Caulobacter zeae]